MLQSKLVLDSAGSSCQVTLTNLAGVVQAVFHSNQAKSCYVLEQIHSSPPANRTCDMRHSRLYQPKDKSMLIPGVSFQYMWKC